MTWMRAGRWDHGAVTAGVLLLTLIAAPALAQEEDPSDDLGDLGMQAEEDSLVVEDAFAPPEPEAEEPAVDDSTKLRLLQQQRANQKGFRWLALGSQRPEAKVGFDSDRSRYGWYLDLGLPLDLLGGFQTKSSYHTDLYQEPTTNQEKSTQRFETRWDRGVGDGGRFQLGLRRQANTTDRTGFETSTSDDTALNSSLTGKGLFRNGLRHAWSLKGQISDRNASSGTRSGSTEQRLNQGTAALGLSRGLGAWEIGVSGGVDAAAGPQTLAATTDGSNAQQDTKATVGDTLGVQLRWQGTGKRSFGVKVRREAFREERLDYAKDNRGVDIFDPDTQQKIVGQEEETRNLTRVELNGETRLLPPVRVQARYSHERRETEYTLSRQGFVPEQSDDFSGDLWFRYAQAGSLKVSLGLRERWDDRRSPGEEDLRGKHFSVSNNIRFTLEQGVMAATDLKLSWSQDLSQQIYDYDLTIGTQDVDILTDLVEAQLKSQAFDALTMSITGSVKQTQNIYIDAEQVASNNRDQDVWKVTGDYTWDLTPSVSFGQSYQLSIDYTDYHYSYVPEVDRQDTYYKRTQMRSELGVDLPLRSSFHLNHVVDRTRGGEKTVVAGFESSGYSDDPTRRQDEHRVAAGVTVPVLGYTFALETNKTFRTRGETATEYLGDIRTRISGRNNFFGDRLQLNLDLGYVWAYGPPRVIRTDRDKRYLTCRTNLVWTF
jgi:hypothetical protein